MWLLLLVISIISSRWPQQAVHKLFLGTPYISSGILRHCCHRMPMALVLYEMLLPMALALYEMCLSRIQLLYFHIVSAF